MIPADETGRLIAEAERFLASLPDLTRPIIHRYFRTALDVESKADNSPVTRADRDVEIAVRAALSEQFPHHAIIGEEQGGQADSRFCWVIDPIDGTRAFVIGKPTFGTLVAFCIDGVAVASVIDMPQLDECYLSWEGGAVLQTSTSRTPLHSSQCQNISDAHIATTSPEAFSAQGLNQFNAVVRACLSSHYGGDCYNYALLAAGHIDIVMEHQLALHDIMALLPVLTGSGATISDWQGQPVTHSTDGSLLASATPELHASALELIARTASSADV